MGLYERAREMCKSRAKKWKTKRVLKQLAVSDYLLNYSEREERRAFPDEESLINRVYKGPFDMLVVCGQYVAVCTHVFI